MKIAALLTSAGINVALCAVFLLLYSTLRKQPGNAGVYFGRRLAQERFKRREPFRFERLVPSLGWIVKAWRCTEDEILAVAGLDAVVFLRIIVFSIRIFSIAASVCVFGVLPLNYFGQETRHSKLPSESLDLFTIANVKGGSYWLWVHCLALYVISGSACILLYFEYKSICSMRLAHINGSPPNPSHFSILVRAIPPSPDEPLSDTVKNFFTKYYGKSYLSHQMVYRTGKVQKLMSDAEKVYKKITCLKLNNLDLKCGPSIYRCGLCGGTSTFQLYHNEFELIDERGGLNHSNSSMEEKECPAAFVFFKTRYAAVVTSQVLQSSNPMLWVTDLAPEPHDVYWSNLWVPYRQLWFRRIAIIMASIVFMFLFLIPVTFVQGLVVLDQLEQRFPFLQGMLKRKFMSQLVTGYLPSVILQLFLYMVPPIMLIFSAMEGSISRSVRKKSACWKVLYFTIWNVFFVNVLSGSLIDQLSVLSTPKGIPSQLAKAVPRQATFFITYVLTSGWASLSFEVVQFFPLLWSIVQKLIMQTKDDPEFVQSFPFHVELPKVLLFGLLGFTCSILAPLILPFLLIYFLLGYVVYRNQVLLGSLRLACGVLSIVLLPFKSCHLEYNQLPLLLHTIMNVYCSKYETGGRMWPTVHNTTIFSLVLAQIIALGVFGTKDSPVAAGFTIPLVIFTLLFNEYCRQRFYPIFKRFSAMDLMEKDWKDEESGKMEEIHQSLHTAYCQFPLDTNGTGEDLIDTEKCTEDAESSRTKHIP